MSFIPHTDLEVKQMLTAIGAASIDELFDEVPKELLVQQDLLGRGLNELELKQLMQKRQAQDADVLCFAGAGAYEHHIPSAVGSIVSRGEFYSAYTPYQAEASQGSLQLIYEFQSMICELMAMPVANASLYDGATSLAESVLMALRINKKKPGKKVLVPEALHPNYRKVLSTLTRNQQVKIQELSFCYETGQTSFANLEEALADTSVLVLNQPNFFGTLEQLDAVVNLAHAHQVVVVAVVNPLISSTVVPPGQWGERGADIACGEGQPLGVALCSGGPYFGFMATQKAHLRQLPGRIVGRTTDNQGRPGFTLTLQAREQHIRRAKATSNICTNQGLMVVAATVYMSLLGGHGLQKVVSQCQQNAKQLQELLADDKRIKVRFTGPSLYEFTLEIQGSVSKLIDAMVAQRIMPGIALGPYYPDLANCLLVAVTETKTPEQLEKYCEVLKNADF